jgi:hypothetical protein
MSEHGQLTQEQAQVLYRKLLRILYRRCFACGGVNYQERADAFLALAHLYGYDVQGWG